MLDHRALEASLNDLVRRHEVLRTHVEVIDEDPMQVVEADCRVSLRRDDLGAFDDGARAAALARATEAEASTPFDLARGPLLRARVLALGAHEHVVLLTLHHLVMDGWSLGVLTRELAVLYAAHHAGADAELPALPVQYGDFARWQRAWLQGDAARGAARVLDDAIAGAAARSSRCPPIVRAPRCRARAAGASRSACRRQ